MQNPFLRAEVHYGTQAWFSTAGMNLSTISLEQGWFQNFPPLLVYNNARS
jgi:hypothetical protein